MTESDLEINRDLSAAENFVHLNNLDSNSRKIAPMSPVKVGFVSFSERQLVALFWKRPVLKAKILELVRATFPTCSALQDVTDEWLPFQEPGYLITRLIVNVNRQGLTARQRRKAGYRAAVEELTIEQLRGHLSSIRRSEFDPRTYDRKGYALAGSIRTNGFRIQLAAFKLRELQAVRFRRLPDNLLPPCLTSTVGGTDYYLREIRNIVKTMENVTQHWPLCAPEEIKVLCLDLGQSYVVGASAFIPQSASPTSDRKGKTIRTTTAVPTHASSALSAPMALSASTALSDSSASTTISASSAATAAIIATKPPYPEVFYNLAVNIKAVSQPNFKFRRWSENEKRVVSVNTGKSVQEIESNLPPLRGSNRTIAEYVQELENAETQLDNFYNNGRYCSHDWDSERARKEEFWKIADSLLRSVGGSVGVKRKEGNMAVIGIGLGKFSSRSGISSLHGSFLAFFVPLVSALSCRCLSWCVN